MVIAKNEIVINGKTLSIETGRIARQANGAVMVRYGDTVVFTAVTAAELDRDVDFFPLTVDYREKTYAAGKFPGGFFKREGRPTTKEILTARLVDRPIRPLFPDSMNHEVSVSSMVVSADEENDPDLLAMVGASAALSVSDIPFDGPVGAVRVGKVDGQLVFYPTQTQLETSTLDLVLAGTKDAIVMVECGAKELPEDEMIDALLQGHDVIKQVIELIESLAKQSAKPKFELKEPEDHSELENQIASEFSEQYKEAILTEGKLNKKIATKAVTKVVLEKYCPELDPSETPDPNAPSKGLIKGLIEKVCKKVERGLIINENRRADGRGLTDIRPIEIEVGVLPRTHGSAIFTRGETQALVVATLGTGDDEQIVDGLFSEEREKFMLHYNFPSYCVGEAWPNRGPKRREIGHGALARRSIVPVLPDGDKFPYTVRVVSEITESNGSSSMASVCGGTMAMMDAGVKIRQPVAGIAMGLIKEGEEVRILSDILGSEDHNGDMDFKVSGTQNGITALQMDIKIGGISREVLTEALGQAREGRIQILRTMLGVLDRPRGEISQYAPKIIRIKINPEKIGIVIGPGGKVIKGIQEETKAKLEIEEDGTVNIWGDGLASAEAARQMVEALTEEVQPGRIYKDCRVVSVKDFGCFVEVLPGQEGLVHVSELGQGFIQNVADEVSIGDRIDVKCIGVDNQGRIKLSKKALEAPPQS